ncbi:SOUL heme-binding protein [Halogeometricum pallidum JCM 14848]|uniref:SOUL heme-binding protein n=1 Tax=Halogeometricum pallidum JCM 14848 TaxID=1227487 RepID=M0D9Q8_HALPD|nr:heme-binding protein [Halogeometricum pallidum]ELZ31528.1 SOUL heme-binding protein [Halogeometricum pallidum JCM 14848]
MRTKSKLLLGGVGTALAAWVGWGVYSAQSADRVPYETLGSLGDGAVELRRYPRTLLVETTARDDETAFRRLFGYISGANEGSRDLAMTAPVRSDESDTKRDGESVPMTTPVRTENGSSVSMTAPVRSDEGDDGVRMGFFLPAEYTQETAPVPTDPDVRLVVEGPRTVAVRSFSWRATDRRVANAEESLRATLEREGVEPRGEPTLLRYNDPYTPPFMRRNEVSVLVSTDGSTDAS